MADQCVFIAAVLGGKEALYLSVVDVADGACIALEWVDGIDEMHAYRC